MCLFPPSMLNTYGTPTLEYCSEKIEVPTHSGRKMNIEEDIQHHQITAALRIRPFSQLEMERGVQCITHKLGEQILLLKDPSGESKDFLQAKRSRDRTFVFDAVFDQEATQEQVYRSTVKNLVEGILHGYNATVFAYGPTGTGKTYTMLGMDCESGIFIQMLDDLFQAIQDMKTMEYSVSLSFLEIYNETMRDLLNPSGVLELRDDSKGNVKIAGITEFFPSNSEEAVALVKKGNKHRTQEPTAANKASSRSHAILQVIVKQSSKATSPQEEAQTAKLFLIDLAGSERASQTQNRSKRIKEGAHINLSLLALGNCITALSDRGRHPHVNYRDSKLTRLLKDALSGNSRTVIIAHVSPSIFAYEETRTTLIYASRAKNIKTTVRRNYESAAHHVTKYSRAIYNLHRELQRLHKRIKEHGQEIKGLKHIGKRIINPQEVVHQADNLNIQEEPTALKIQLQHVIEEHMKVRRSLLQLDNAQLEMHVEAVRHLSTITDWEQSKARSDTHQREEKAAENTAMDEGDDEEDEALVDNIDLPEPQEVMAAREEVNMLLSEQKKTAALMAALKEQWAKTKMKTSQLEQQMSQQFSSDHTELFRLLHRVHELQICNTELLAKSICKENILYQKDFVILSYQHYRSLCQKIIQLQQTFIDEKVHNQEQLENLSHLGSHEAEQRRMRQMELLNELLSSRLEDDIFHNGTEAEKYWGAHLHLDIEQNDTSVADSRKSTANHTRLTLSSTSSDLDSSGYRTPKSTPGLKPPRQPSSSSLLTPFHHLRVPTQNGKHEISNDPSIEGTPTRLFTHPLEDNGKHTLAVLKLSSDELEEIAAGTRSISLVAARRRSKVYEIDSPYILKERSGPSPLPPLQTNEYLPITGFHAHVTRVRKAVSSENLPAIILRKDEAKSAIGSSSSRKDGRQKTYWDKRSHSFEAPTSQLSKSKQHSFHRRDPGRLPHAISPNITFYVTSPNAESKIKSSLTNKTFVKSRGNSLSSITSGLKPNSIEMSGPEEAPAGRTPLALPQNLKNSPGTTKRKLKM